MYEDEHLESDYEDRNGDPIGIATFEPEWDELDDPDRMHDLDEEDDTFYCDTCGEYHN